ncbi:putative aconitase subunit 1 [Geoglobus ahangari]|uniref:Phosphomevalonate dehydratase large subunit n=1 Tax=Geoglobus ahangari TaxID=113653 RepID=A0A0F7IIH3_9EURY|nr:aconitase X catalytic domain-containing protein [Geoglobus ahangari]AKG91813.1 putative aconitase subunit 1 [Geoglobus ahangari]
MHLTKEEERLLESDNETVRKCMEILVALGEIYGAERLVEIRSAQISGISYDNIGDAGLEWLESLKAKVVVRAYANPAGLDTVRWREMGIDSEFYEKQMRIIRALDGLGVEITLTCTPYYLDTPSFGDHLAWAESSAVVYANSVIGARTNRESGISALAAAIIGKTPMYGLHLKENRAPQIRVIVEEGVNPAMAGYHAGKLIGGKIPLVEFPERLSRDELKWFGASLAASGGAGMFHAKELTPEWDSFEIPEESVVVEKGDVDSGCEPDLVAIGCPHTSAEELRTVYSLLRKYGKVRREMWIFSSRRVIEQNRELVEKIEEMGAKVFADTCMVVSPASSRFECVMVNSGKAFEYLPKLRGVNARFGDLEECVRWATR